MKEKVIPSGKGDRPTIRAVLEETRTDMERAKEIGKKADELHEEAMRRRLGRA